MDIKEIQLGLNSQFIKVDGVPGRKTMSRVDELLGPVSEDWSDARKLIAIEQFIMKGKSIDVGEVDGIIGPQTRWARTIWDARGKDKSKPNDKEEKWRDKEKPGPERNTIWPKQSAVQQYYGTPGTGFTTIEMPFPLRLAWQPTTKLTKVAVHSKCAGSFLNVWKNVLNHYGYDELRRLRLDMFGGCANVRKKRGGSSWSMHAYACAWDIDPDRNQLKFKRAQASLDETSYIPFWNIVYAQGGLSLGIEKDYDWMHFQFTRDFS